MKLLEFGTIAFDETEITVPESPRPIDFQNILVHVITDLSAL